MEIAHLYTIFFSLSDFLFLIVLTSSVCIVSEIRKCIFRRQGQTTHIDQNVYSMV
jgi:hypothetical protein